MILLIKKSFSNSLLMQAVLALMLVSAAFAQERYLKPIDEAGLDASFLAFRKGVIAAAERKDAAFIIGILDPQIKLSFGGHEGIADFRRTWKINQRNSEFWDEFLPVIKNGGTFFRENGKRTNLFYAPYTFDGFPDDLDAFEHSVIFGSNVNLRDAGNMAAKIIGQLSYNVVTIDQSSYAGDASKRPGWLKIKTLGGLSGYVKSEYVRSPIDFRAGFEKKRGKWKMVTFIAGD